MLYPPEFGNTPLFPHQKDFAVVAINDDVGKGVISYRAFQAGDPIADIAGYKVADIMQHTLQISPTVHNYDPFFSGYFLHACEPNISVDMQAMTVTALKPIAAGDYLYMDYAETEEKLFKQFPCSCGHHNCRGWITGNQEVAENLVAASATMAEIQEL